jgi:hypothetical protein
VECKSIIHAVLHSFSGVICAGVVLLISSSAQAQNLFVSDYWGNCINEFTPDGTQSTFASGLNGPSGLAFGVAGRRCHRIPHPPLQASLNNARNDLPECLPPA